MPEKLTPEQRQAVLRLLARGKDRDAVTPGQVPAADPQLCARCFESLSPGDGPFYVVEIVAYADPSGPTGELPAPDDVSRQLDAVIRQLRDVSAQEAMDEVHRRLTIHLCRPCYRGWIENPAGA